MLSSVLMTLSSLAFFSAIALLIVLPPGPSSAAAIVLSMMTTLVLASILLAIRRGENLPTTRLMGRSTFSEGF